MNNEINIYALAKAFALIVWADEKLYKTEISEAKETFEKYGAKWEEIEPLFHNYLKELGDSSFMQHHDNELFDEMNIEEFLGKIDFNVPNPKMILDDLARLVLSDKIVSKKEIQILNIIAKAIDLDPSDVSVSLLKMYDIERNIKHK